MGVDVSFRDTLKGKVALGKFQGKGKLNLVDEDVLLEAAETVKRLSLDEEVRCLILEGKDELAFIGGADLKVLRQLNPTSAKSFIVSIHSFCSILRSSNFPVIAKIRGYCLGAGMEIAAACDIRVGDESIKCGMPEVRVGVPSVVEAALLPALLGSGKAKEVMLRGNIFGSDEALSIGFLQRLTKSSQLESLSELIETDILSGGPKAMTLQKELFKEWDGLSVNEGIEKGIEVCSRSYLSDEPKKMIDRFFDRKNED